MGVISLQCGPASQTERGSMDKRQIFMRCYSCYSTAVAAVDHPVRAEVAELHMATRWGLQTSN